MFHSCDLSRTVDWLNLIVREVHEYFAQLVNDFIVAVMEMMEWSHVVSCDALKTFEMIIN